jgi:hypothetical protein
MMHNIYWERSQEGISLTVTKVCIREIRFLTLPLLNYFLTLSLMIHSLLNLTVNKISTTFILKNLLLTTSHFSKYSDVELYLADNRFWNVVWCRLVKICQPFRGKEMSHSLGQRLHTATFQNILLLLWGCGPTQVLASSFTRFLDHTQWHKTLDRTLVDEWPACRRNLYLATHNTHKRQTFMPPAVFEPTIFSRRAAANLRLRLRGHCDRQISKYVVS